MSSMSIVPILVPLSLAYLFRQHGFKVLAVNEVLGPIPDD